MSKDILATLQNNWTAEVKLNNGQIISIWHTAFHSCKDSIEEVLSVSSDYPRVIKCKIGNYNITTTFI